MGKCRGYHHISISLVGLLGSALSIVQHSLIAQTTVYFLLFLFIFAAIEIIADVCLPRCCHL